MAVNRRSPKRVSLCEPSPSPSFPFVKHNEQLLALLGWVLIDSFSNHRSNTMQDEKTYTVRVTVYHQFTVEANSEAQARNRAVSEAIWDEHVKDCIIDIEETD